MGRRSIGVMFQSFQVVAKQPLRKYRDINWEQSVHGLVRFQSSLGKFISFRVKNKTAWRVIKAHLLFLYKAGLKT